MSARVWPALVLWSVSQPIYVLALLTNGDGALGKLLGAASALVSRHESPNTPIGRICESIFNFKESRTKESVSIHQ